MIWPSPTLEEVMITLSAFKDGEKMILGNPEKFLGKIPLSEMEIFFRSWKFQMDNFIVGPIFL